MTATVPDAAELRAHREAAAAAVRGLSRPDMAERLEAYPIADVLLWGLSEGGSDPVIGILGAAREIVYVVAGYVDLRDAEVCTAKPAIETVGRMVDVALELLRRVRRAERKDGAP